MTPVALGLSLREPWAEELASWSDRGPFEVLEVMVDDLLEPCGHRAAVRKLGARWSLLAHGVDLGIGDAAGVDEGYVARVHDALRALRVRWWSDHLAFLRAGAIDLGHFGPLEADEETLRVLAANARRARRGAPCPLLLENPSDILGLGVDGPSSGRSLGAALRRCVEAADVGILLDVTNLLYDAANGGWDPAGYLEALPWDRVVQVHLAGGRRANGLWIDTHSRPVPDAALELLAEVARRAPSLRAVTLEWDEDVPTLAVALEELGRAERVLAAAGRR